MLKHLDVKNFALIDDLEIDFNHGLTALTGVTGSGKSILLESLSLLFGKRSDAEYIRFGKTKATVKGVFSLSLIQMDKLGLPKEITLVREIDASGKHNVKLNDETITLSRLKNISSEIGLIHGQNDLYQLLDRSTYVLFIDQINLSAINEMMRSYLLKRSSYLEALEHYESLKSRKNESLERVDFLTFQIKELESFNLVKDEKNRIEDDIAKLKNFDVIKQALAFSNETLNSEMFQMDLMYEVIRQLDKIKKLDSNYEEIHKILENSYYNMDEAIKSIKHALDHLDFDADLFNSYQERVYELSKIETKYQKSNNELVEYLSSIKEELAISVDYEGYLKKAQSHTDALYLEAYNSALKLHDLRIKLAKKLALELTKSLQELDLDKAKFEIIFDDVKEGINLDESGIDKVEFMISLNDGEPLKPLSKVASGGEKARFMFALKSFFAKNSGLSMLVFDEIDIGISGKTASKVALKMHEISKDIQTLVITHLPQVAARADHHYAIYKDKVDDRMQTFIKVLNYDEKVLSIASMLSDDEISSFAIEQAKALLKK